MAMFNTSEFFGIAPKIPPRYLKPGYAQVAKNCEVIGNSIKPLKGLSAAVHTLPTGSAKTIYKFGQDTDSPSQHWFSWDTDVDVCRSQIAGDENEWTFYTGDGAPKATYEAIALGGGQLPTASIPLGIPAPDVAPLLSEIAYVPDTEPAVLYLSPAALQGLTTAYGLDVSLDNEATYQNVALANTSAETVAAALNTVSGVVAVVEGGGVEVETVATGRDVTLHLRIAPDTYVAKDARGVDATPAKLHVFKYQYDEMVAWHNQIYNSNPMEYAVVVTVYAYDPNTGGERLVFSKTYPKGSSFTPVTDINNAAAVNAYVAEDGGFYIEYAEGAGSQTFVRFHAYQARSGNEIRARAVGTDVAPAVLVLTPAETMMFNVVDDIQVAFSPPDYIRVELPGTTPSAIATAMDPIVGLSARAEGVNVVVTTDQTGSLAYVVVAWRGTRSNIITSTGKTLDTGVKETRVYVFTWVAKVAGFEMESAPSPATESIDVFPNQGVTLSEFPPLPEGFPISHRRVYRSVDGTYLYTGELGIDEITWDDTVEADDLGEELPSLDWAMPPEALAGLVNLPNGIMAGFVGRDIYFSVPYRPYAWPLTYVQTVDYPIIGLGVIDTTLVVLTRGTPYFIQGASPDSMVVVKTDIEQACVSKRSIVSIAGSVVYASPDGLVSVSPGRSKVLTEGVLTRAQWQTAIVPESVHSFEHDLMYFAFYSGAEQGGFIIDFSSGSFMTHTLYAVCGFSELRTDTLFVSNGTNIYVWGGGAGMNAIWRSKLHSFPQYMWFNCAQLEAEAFPVLFRLYAEGELVHAQTVSNRGPFRLPVKGGRDWEVEIETYHEVFNFVVAQSMEEIARV